MAEDRAHAAAVQSCLSALTLAVSHPTPYYPLTTNTHLQGGVLEVDPNTPSTITAFGPGYIDK